MQRSTRTPASAVERRHGRHQSRTGRRVLGLKGQEFPSPIRPRWGDHGAAAVDGNSVWIASEYIGQACNHTDWGGPFFDGGSGDNLLGRCGGANHSPGARSALANWSTRISKLTP